jgi:large conductance mechanosensitive channel
MRNFVTEFKAFLNKGNVLTVAVGLVIALYFKTIIDSVVDGIINPIIAAILGKDGIGAVGIDIGKARINLGLVINAIISFVLVAFVLFLVVKAYNASQKKDEEVAGPTEVELLTEIRDSLRNR